MSKYSKLALRIGLALGLISTVSYYGIATAADDADFSPITKPLGVSKDDVPPNVMMILGRDHNLFTAAYSDYTPLIANDKGDLYTLYHPEFIYEGMFSSDICYAYEKNSDEGQSVWKPASMALVKDTIISADGKSKKNIYKCDGKSWLGNFLNYVTSSRMDVIKVALYGGSRKIKDNKEQFYYNWSTTEKSAVLEHSYALIDAHAWAKVFADRMYNNFSDIPSITINEITPLSATDNTNAYFFGVYPKKYANNGYARLRVVKVTNANIPGDTNPDGKNAVWTWISQESTDNVNFRYNSWAVKEGEDYLINVVACSPTLYSRYNNNCVKYSYNNVDYYQPEGIIQQYGVGPEARMHFGLLTGSWSSSRAGGRLRDNISNKSDEYDLNTGALKYKDCGGKRCGFAGSLDQFRVKKGNNQYEDCNRGKASLEKMLGSDNVCQDWGNPIAELLYQSTNYFQNKNVEGVSMPSNRDGDIELGCVGDAGGDKTSNRQNPYDTTNYCAKAVSFVISDEAPTYDALAANLDDSTGVGIPTTISSSDQTEIISELQNRFSVDGKYLVGFSKSATDDEKRYRALPTVKTVKSLVDITGIAPTQAFSYGSYNIAGVASWALGKDKSHPNLQNDGARGKFSMQTFVLAMKPNVAEIKIPAGDGRYVRLIPLAKTPADDFTGVDSPAADDASLNQNYRLMSTNQIAGFYIQYNKADEGAFRVSFEDFQNGSDYDMDVVIGYYYKIFTSGNDKYIQVKLSFIDGDIFSPQHAGYVITGVDYSGTYLDLGKRKANNNSDKQGNLYALDNYVSDGNFTTCKGELTSSDLTSSSKSFLNCLQDTSKKVTPNASLSISDSTIANYYKDIVDYKANRSTGKTCEANSTDANCFPVYYMPRYMFSLFADQSLTNKTDPRSYKFFKLAGAPHDWRLIGDRSRYENATNGKGISESSRIFRISSASSSDVWLQSPLWFAAKAGKDFEQRETGNNVEPTNFSYVTNPAEFRENIRKLINSLVNSVHSGSSFTPATTSTTGGTDVYFSSYNPKIWFGTVYKAKVASSTGLTDTTSINTCWYTDNCDTVTDKGWNAAYEFANMTPEDRLIVTYDKEQGKLKRVYVTESEADDTSVTAESLGLDIFGMVSDQRLKYFVRWLGGDDSHEGTVAEFEEAAAESSDKVVLRQRLDDVSGNGSSFKHFVLGDIVNSDVTMVKIGSRKYIAVGANDGMLHILDESTGRPIVSFIPSEAREKIIKTADVNYESGHLFFVDSTPMSFKRASDNKTYLYGSLGLNLKGGYLLDLSALDNATDRTPEALFNYLKSNKFYRWEVTGDSSRLIGKFRESPLHYAVGGKDYLVYSSGYDACIPGVYVVNAFPATGENLIAAEIPLNPSSTTSVSSGSCEAGHRAISPFEIFARQSSSGTVPVAMYVGDTEGYLYQIKLDGGVLGKPQCWGFTNSSCAVTSGSARDYQPKVVFHAKDAVGVSQPITAKPAVGYLKSGGHGVFFGTGSYWTPYDDTTASGEQIQTFYCLKRANGNVSDDLTLERSNLRQVIRKSGEEASCVRDPITGYAKKDDDGNPVCSGNWSPVASTTSADQVKGRNGWYMDLRSFSDSVSSTNGTGERIYRAPLVLGNYVYAVTSVPNIADSCETGGRSYLFVMDTDTGDGELKVEIQGLANEMRTTVHDGQVQVDIGYDNNEKGTGGKGEFSLPANNLPKLRESTWIRLY